MARKSILGALKPSRRTEPPANDEQGGLAVTEPPQPEPEHAREEQLHEARPEETASAPDELSTVATEVAAATAGTHEAVHEAAQAAEKAEQALLADGAKVRTPKPIEDKPPTRAQLIRRARRQREFGRKILARRTAGFASITVPVKLNNGALAGTFERFFSVIENCCYLVARHGGAVLGENQAEKILARIDAMVAEVLTDRQKELAAAQAYAGEAAVQLGERFITPTFTQPALQAQVQLRSPQARRVLDLFTIGDAILTEAETLYWNGIRTLSEKSDEALRAKRTVRRLFTFSAVTTLNLYRRMNMYAAVEDLEAVLASAAGPAAPRRQARAAAASAPAPASAAA